jgi:predicted Zn-dependent protease
MISLTNYVLYLRSLFFIVFLFTAPVFGWDNEVNIERIDRATIDKRIHEVIETAGILINDPQLIHHLTKLTAHITSALPGTSPPYRIRVINSSELNAFSLSDGTVYISLGMFGMIDNDAQLAMLLAHEIAHINLDHHRLYRYELHKAAATQSFWGDNTPYNLRTALSGFSIAQEHAADSIALVTLINRGYNAWEAKKLILTMYRWLKYKEKSRESSTATHPMLSKRYYANKNRLLNIHFDSTSGIIGDSAYQTAISKHQHSIVSLLRQSNCVNELYAMSKSKIKKNSTLPDWYYLRGSLMERFHPVDSFAVAYKSLSTALKKDASFTSGLRDLGWLFLKNKQYDSARTYLSQYLIHSPHAADTALVFFYLESLNE